MIKVNVDGELYTIINSSVSEGKYKEFLECCISMCEMEYSVSRGFWEPYLYIYLGRFKMIERVSCDFVFPRDKGCVY